MTDTKIPEEQEPKHPIEEGIAPEEDVSSDSEAVTSQFKKERPPYKFDALDFYDVNESFRCYAAQNFEDLKSAYELVYREYRRRGYCAPNEAKMHSSFYCTLPESRTFLLKSKERLMGTVTLIVDSYCGLPMEVTFRDQVHKLREQGRRLGEVSLLALDREEFPKSFSLADFQRVTGNYTFRLFKLLFDYARFVAQVTDLVISIHPRHEELYRYLTFESMGAVRPYLPACGKPALPMLMNIRKTVSVLYQMDGVLHDFVDGTPFKDEELFDADFAWSPAMLKEFLVEKNSIWEKLPRSHQEYFRSRYPEFRT